MVCDDGWDTDDATVVCRQLGYSYAWLISGIAGTGPIWLSRLSCTGSEPRLTDCTQNNNETKNCTHSDDVGVFCGNDFHYELQDYPYMGHYPYIYYRHEIRSKLTFCKCMFKFFESQLYQSD